MNLDLLEDTDNKEEQSSIPSQQLVMQMLSGVFFSMIIKSALELGVFSAINDGICTLNKLADSLKVNQSALRRLLRGLCSAGLLYEVQPNQYDVTNVGATLLPGTTPKSLESIAKYLLSDNIILPLVNLNYSIRTGKPSFNKIMGRGWYDCNEENSDELSIMDKGMETYSKMSLPDILEAYPFEKYDMIVDIAGGLGQMLIGMLNLNKTAKGKLFDTPETIERAKNYISSNEFKNRIEFIPGDMFEKIPATEGLYVISKALNDWDDEHVKCVLKNIKSAMQENSKLILIEQLAIDGIPTPEEVTRDLIFLVCTPGGVVRTRNDFMNIIDEVGLKTTNIIVTKSGFSLIECTQ